MSTVRLEVDDAGVAWVVFDNPDAKVNLLDVVTVQQLDKILDSLLQRVPKAVIFISGKPGIFIAGADIKELAKIDDSMQGAELSRAGHRIFGKIARLSATTVAAIDGACLGGGCELALACRHRVATDNPKTVIGLPETQLGIIPGWGGTQRLPRLVGLRAALDIIVPGKSLKAIKAAKVGLVDAVCAPNDLRRAAASLAAGKKGLSLLKKVERLPPVRQLICKMARKQVLARTRGHYPAPLKAIDAMEQGVAVSLEQGLEIEARIFGELAVMPQAKNLIRVFFLREKYSKLRLPGARGEGAARKIEKIGVIGAGVMGAGIAQWCSSRGLTVRLKDIRPEFVAAGMKRIADAYREGVSRRKVTELDAQRGLARVHPTIDYTGFSDCDLVVEAVLEKIEVKTPVFNELTPLLKKDCIIASNTSAIPIDDLAAACGRPKQFVGIHFFNPVHKMPLVEVVRGTKTSPEVLAAAVEFATQLRKIPVVVKGAPGFLVNRLLMPYLNEAGLMLGEGVGVEEMDRAMLQFGMPMGPCRLIDEVGIDVAVDVARELAEAFSDRMSVAPILQKMHDMGLKGRKGGAGFFRYNGKRQQLNPQIKPLLGRMQAAGSPEGIQKRLLNVMIAEAKRCLEEDIVETEDDIDTAMIFGTGFPPFRGGLVKHARDSGHW